MRTCVAGDQSAAAGEHSEPAEPNQEFIRACVAGESLSPAHAGSESFSAVSPGSLRSPGAINLSRFVLKSAFKVITESSLMVGRMPPAADVDTR